MSIGGGTSRQSSTPELTAEEKQAISAQTNFLTGQIIPAYQRAVGTAETVYGNIAPGIEQSAQQLQASGQQVSKALGMGGGFALGQGLTGLSNVFNPGYEQQQLSAALIPATLEYKRNIAAQGAQFGGAGQLGSARQALAGQRTAADTMLQQQMAASQVLSDIENRKAAAAQELTSAGLTALPQALQAQAAATSATTIPLTAAGEYASILFGTPSSSYAANFAGTRGETQSKSGFSFSFGK